MQLINNNTTSTHISTKFSVWPAN